MLSRPLPGELGLRAAEAATASALPVEGMVREPVLADLHVLPVLQAHLVHPLLADVGAVEGPEVDAEVVSVLGSCSWAQVDRCIQAALTRYEDALDEDSEDATDEDTDNDEDTEPTDAGAVEDGAVEDDEEARDVQVHLRDAGTDPHMLGGRGIGLTGISGLLDDADALDLEQGISIVEQPAD